MFAPTARRAFSLIELVIVVVIIGIIAAIAIPRMSRGATGAGDGALAANLAVLRNAIDLFQTEHGGTWPDATTITAQLKGYTNAAGTVGTKGDGVSIYGPYLRDVPPLSVNCPRKGQSGIATADAAAVGWIYDGAGNIKANTTTEKDDAGKLYNLY